jgi:hypothetical protein
MKDTPISAHDRDLAELASSSRPDRMLAVLASLADAGSTYTLGLLVNGMTIYGRTISPKQLATLLDEENVRMAERWKATGAPGWDEAGEKIRGLWEKSFEEYQAERRMLVEHTTGDVDDLPEEIGRMVIRGQGMSVTLSDVHVFSPGSPGFELPFLRVRLSMVAGWWLVPSDEHGRASFEHPVQRGY